MPEQMGRRDDYPVVRIVKPLKTHDEANILRSKGLADPLNVGAFWIDLLVIIENSLFCDRRRE